MATNTAIPPPNLHGAVATENQDGLMSKGDKVALAHAQSGMVLTGALVVNQPDTTLFTIVAAPIPSGRFAGDVKARVVLVVVPHAAVVAITVTAQADLLDTAPIVFTTTVPGAGADVPVTLDFMTIAFAQEPPNAVFALSVICVGGTMTVYDAVIIIQDA